jgi:hypothetical protein
MALPFTLKKYLKAKEKSIERMCLSLLTMDLNTMSRYVVNIVISFEVGSA